METDHAPDLTLQADALPRASDDTMQIVHAIAPLVLLATRQRTEICVRVLGAPDAEVMELLLGCLSRTRRRQGGDGLLMMVTLEDVDGLDVIVAGVR